MPERRQTLTVTDLNTFYRPHARWHKDYVEKQARDGLIIVVTASRESRHVPTAQPPADEKARHERCNGLQGVNPKPPRYSNTH